MSDNNVLEFNKQSVQEFKKYTVVGVIIVSILLLGALVFNNLYIVQENEYKVVRQFGEVTRVIKEPGLNYKIPFIQSVTTLPKYVMIYDVQPAEINTLDKKRITVDNYAVWKIVDPKAMIENAKTVAFVEDHLGNFIYSNIRTELGTLNYDEIINSEESSRGNFTENVRVQVNRILESQSFGIEVVDVRMKRTDLPESNEQAVYTRMISERESTAQQYLSQGDAEATKVRAETDREVQEMLATANADAKSIIGEGEQEAARIYNESYGKDPEFYNMYRTLESYRTTLKGEPVIILPSSSPYARYLMGE